MNPSKTPLIANQSPHRKNFAVQLAMKLCNPVALSIAGVPILVVHLLFGDEMYPSEARLLAGVLAIAAYFSLLQLAKSRERRELPFRELYVVLFYVFFGMPVFWEDALPLVGGLYHPSNEALDLALVSAVLSLAVFYCFYPLGCRLGYWARPIVTIVVPKTVPSNSSGLFTLLVLIPVVMTTTYSLSISAGAVPGDMRRLLLATASSTLLLATALRLADITKAPTFRLAGTVALGISVLIGLLTGMLEAFLLPIAVITVSGWLSSRRPRVPWILVGLVLFIIFNPAKLAYRTGTYDLANIEGRALTVGEKIEVWQDAVSNKWGVGDNIQENLSSSRSRMSDLLPVAQVIDYVPEKVSYAFGEPWIAIPYSFVPRLIWPDKPDLTQMTNGVYAVNFNRLSADQVQVTTFNLPPMADGYWNLGWFGIVIVAILAGLSLGFKAGAFDTRHWSTCAIAIVFFVGIRPQADLNSIIGGSLQTYIGAVIFFYVLVYGERVLQLGRLLPSPRLRTRTN